MVISPRSPYGGNLAANTMYGDVLSKYMNNWGATIANQGMEEVLQALIAMQGQTTGDLADAVATASGAAPVAGDPRGGGSRGGRARDPRFVAGYPAPHGRNPVPESRGRSDSGWALPAGTMGLSREAERAARQARRAARNGEDGVYVDPGHERTRERSRTRTSRDGTTTTSTNVKVSRNGGTAIAVDSGDDGNRQRKKKRATY